MPHPQFITHPSAPDDVSGLTRPRVCLAACCYCASTRPARLLGRSLSVGPAVTSVVAVGGRRRWRCVVVAVPHIVNTSKPACDDRILDASSIEDNGDDDDVVGVDARREGARFPGRRNFERRTPTAECDCSVVDDSTSSSLMDSLRSMRDEGAEIELDLRMNTRDVFEKEELVRWMYDARMLQRRTAGNDVGDVDDGARGEGRTRKKKRSPLIPHCI
ncbi:hypothetical protein ACHAW5_010770 [Stephanodiscus triporus]|uniref:Uncharacterized protein n=1 Tax=Stephanodiscus triporus TaxID=2934178 RepID=A0ABD3PW52_9STRA